MKISKRIALSGMFAALQMALMFLGGVAWIFCYAAPMFSGLLMIILKESAGRKYCFSVYAACSILSILFLPDKECALIYIFFFGYYTAIRDLFDRLPRVVRTVCKFLLFNAGIAASQLLLVYAFRIPFDNDFGKWTIPILAVSFNLLFFFYERLFPVLVLLYEKKYKSRVERFLN